MILVTGGAGFIGSEIVRQLDDVIVIDDLSQGHIKAVNTTVRVCDVSSQLALRKAMEECDAVIHLAALVALSESVGDPGRYFRVDAVGTLNILEAMVHYGIKNLVFASTAAVYGDQSGAMPETAMLLGDSPYAQSKAWSENMIQSFCRAYGINATCFRFFNVGGAGEDHNPETHLIPNVIKAVMEDRPIDIFGFDYPTRDGTALRDYIDVRDIARAHIIALNQLDGFKVYNLGNGKGYTCLDVVEAVGRASGKDVYINRCPRREGDIPGLIADYHKAEKELGWLPEHDINAIVQSAWDWAVAHPGGYDA